jgi:16S rRNA (guanine966-N2)-methyltransferase
MHIIAGTKKHHKIATPKGKQTRPTSERLREALFNICQAYIDNARFLDLFAGSGAMGLEALSRGAGFCSFIDISRESLRCIQENIIKLEFENHTKVFSGDVFTQLKRLAKHGEQFDIIYADPPYGLPVQSKGESLCYSDLVLKIIDETNLLTPSGMFFIEEEQAYKPKIEGLQNLQLVSSRKSGRSALHQFQKK